MKNINFASLILISFICTFAACQPNNSHSNNHQEMTTPRTASLSIQKAAFGILPDGQRTDIYTLRNGNGMEVRITNYGGIITHLFVPDRAGKLADVVLGFDSLPPYLQEHPYFGAIIGRYANRIAKGKFTLEGKTYTLATNNGDNHLHGGLKGFDKYIWMAETKENEKEVTLSLYRVSPDGEEGYPGNLHIQVEYTLNNMNELRIYCAATAEAPTHVNLTNHSYFNLTGDPSNSILGHELQINANAYLPVDKGLIPTGELRNPGGSAFDFREPKKIGRDIGSDDEQLHLGGGYDHCFVLNRDREKLSPQLAAIAHDPSSGRVLEVWTTEPGMQFYTGNFLDGTLTGKGGKVYGRRAGFCLETQHFPDSPNQPDFPSTVLKPGRTFRSTTVYKFSADAPK